MMPMEEEEEEEKRTKGRGRKEEMERKRRQGRREEKVKEQEEQKRKGREGENEEKEKEERRSLIYRTQEIPALQKSSGEASDSVIICCQSYVTNITSHLKYRGHGGLGVRDAALSFRWS
jgi:hypothetical protein